MKAVVSELVCILKEHGLIEKKNVRAGELKSLIVCFDVLDLFSRHNLVRYIHARNIQIKLTYKQLKAQGLGGNRARQVLASAPFIDANGKKYFLSEKQIQEILYTKTKASK